MTNFDKIAKLLPEGLSETGIEEISAIVEETVQERVDSEVKNLEAKVGGFLRMKLNELKEQAITELEKNDETFRAVKVYESLKHVIAEDISTTETDSVTAQYKNENTELHETVGHLNSKMSQLMTENSTLEESLCDLQDTVKSLDETTKKPFKSSEQALVITNESINESAQPTNAVVNSFLTEDVVRLSKLN